MTQVWSASGDRRAVFSECYLVMTRRVHERVRDGAFHDGPWVTGCSTASPTTTSRRSTPTTVSGRRWRAQWSPLASALDLFLGPLDEWAFGTLAQSWRSQVWVDAMDLVRLAPEERSMAAARIGERASGVATIILLGRHPD